MKEPRRSEVKDGRTLHRRATVARVDRAPPTPHRAPASRGILLGRALDEWGWSGRGRSALIIGPPRSGKTSSIITPNVLCASAAVVVTSTKPDVMAMTARARHRVGSCLLFDPTASTDPPPGVVPIGWSPLRSA